MATALHPRVIGYVAVAGGALVAAIALQDAPLAALGIPALVLLAVGLATDSAVSEAAVGIEMSLDRDVAASGESVTVSISLTADRPVPRCAVAVRTPAGTALDREPVWLVELTSSAPVELMLELTVATPGELSIGPVVASVSGRIGLLRGIVEHKAIRLSVRPKEERLRSLPRTSRVRVPSGDRLARLRGEGIELAEVRPQLPGEQARRINWRATARRGVPHVTLRHPEQSTDVVLFTDTFPSPELARVLDATATCAAAYLARRDRVGLVCFGGVLDWVEAGSGRHQLERIRDRLAGTSPFFSYAWKTIERIPPRAMPNGALVVAVSDLRDERFTSAIGAVRARGHDVVVVETGRRRCPVEPGEPARTEVAVLLEAMEHEDLRHRLFLRGIPVATVFPGEPLEPALHALTEVTRRSRPVRMR